MSKKLKKIDQESKLKPEETKTENIEEILCNMNTQQKINDNYCKKTNKCSDEDLINVYVQNNTEFFNKKEKKYICIPIVNYFIKNVKNNLSDIFSNQNTNNIEISDFQSDNVFTENNQINFKKEL